MALTANELQMLMDRFSQIDNRLQEVNARVLQIPEFINTAVRNHEQRCIVRNQTEIAPVKKISWIPVLKILLPLILSGGVIGAIGFQCQVSKDAHASQTQAQNGKN